ncbi:YqzG/YhdC family protein [Oceanobacillus profundus]|uniref:DUF3889 domain-containing protein n=1 Tax=Oceanobacillus profundus TaxID=372463 RepID=UPI002040C008|nr:DUF3889 domain-containing protein [Oceanobacillus profundus]MCM3398125.1 YqzG/YhdC family protein [Oceanobacillus profundus]
MRKLCLALGIAFVLIFSYSLPLQAVNAVQDEGVPSYAKWGKLAVRETKEKYPSAKIIDYLHIGKETTNGSTVEKFKLWLKGETKEFGVFVNIEFNPQTNEVVQITFEETDR